MTWDGRGEDPWLPERLEARLQVAQVERDIWQAFWAALSDWLVRTARRVLRSERPDPDAIWAMVPSWRDAVHALVHGDVQKAMGLAYHQLLGPDFTYSRRAFVIRYLSEVTNRLVRIPEEVYALVAGEMAAGISLGEGIPELAKRVDTVLSTTASERWPNRATVVARTETIGALNGSRADVFAIIADDSDEQLYSMWLATDDARTRHTHNEAEGQRVPVGQPFIVGGFELRFPGDPLGPPQEIINCRCVSLLVDSDEKVDLSNRQTRRS